MKDYFFSSYKVLHKVFSKKAFSTLELSREVSSLKENKAIVTKITYGVIEQDIKDTYIIQSLAKKVKDLPVMLVLKIGTYCLLNMDNLPAFAIVNECVKLCKKLKFASASGLVNAVLKKISLNEFTLPAKSNKQEYLSITYSKPMWFVEKMISDYGLEFAENMLSHKLDPFTTVRVNQAKIHTKQFKTLLTNAGVSYNETFFDDALSVDFAKLVNIENLHGMYTIQNLGSMIICRMAQILDGDKILDCCAAPGGKSVYLAMLNNKGTVESWDIHEHRVELVNKYAQSQGVSNIKTKVYDATILDPSKVEKYDIVVCDVPCSGLGVISSKPDILLNKKPEDIVELAKIQQSILQTCSNYVKPGGQLIYSTCTITKDENQNNIKSFLALNTNFKVELKDFDNFQYVKDDYGITTFPHISGIDGFFVSRMIKND